jgi:hypothetical protein
VTKVSGSWIVPTVSSSSNSPTYSAVWVGIDGYSGNTVEQIGTEQDVINGSTVYQAWWEMYSTGKGQPEQVITGMKISPGDSITASVQYITTGSHAGQYLLSINDTSRPTDSFSAYESSAQLQSPQPERNSAEWIVESPTVGGSVAQAPNFGSVTFTNASAVINGVSGPINDSAWQSQAINMVAGNGTTVAQTSVLTSSGTGFTVTYMGSIQGGANSSDFHTPSKHQKGTIVGVLERAGVLQASPSAIGWVPGAAASGQSWLRAASRERGQATPRNLFDGGGD